MIESVKIHMHTCLCCNNLNEGLSTSVVLHKILNFRPVIVKCKQEQSSIQFIVVAMLLLQPHQH